MRPRNNRARVKEEAELAEAQDSPDLDRVLGDDVVKVTEATAIAAARLRGRGDEAAVDGAAIDAMCRSLARLPINGVVVVGEGEESEATHLYMGETVGAAASGLAVDIAVDPVEGSTLAAKALPNALAVVAIAERGSLLKVPVMYMDKIAIGPGYPDGLVDLDASAADNLNALAKAKGVPVSDITACILDRPRHAKLIEAVRDAGAAVRLIGDGDIAGVIHTTEPEDTGIDVYMGVGGAPEGVLAAAALCCIGGQIQGRLIPANAQQRERAETAGISDLSRKYTMRDMASGDVSFAATGITDGSLLSGVRFSPKAVSTHSVVMRAKPHTVRWIHTEYRDTNRAG
jgi:fructose-1,6-bisphosphatase II / sedoheptulose-1,7-bisphosphatase